MSKYRKLTEFLNQRPTSQWAASFNEVERVLGFDLPDSARRHRPWWANQNGMNHSQTKGWMAAGWMTEDVSLDDERVTFVRREMIRSPALQPRPQAAGELPVTTAQREGMSIAEAKQALAHFYGTSTENIEITIRG
ncbi:MAG: DUF7662 domain-containing protein [Sandarakinorhabdus sp.]